MRTAAMGRSAAKQVSPPGGPRGAPARVLVVIRVSFAGRPITVTPLPALFATNHELCNSASKGSSTDSHFIDHGY